MKNIKLTLIASAVALALPGAAFAATDATPPAGYVPLRGVSGPPAATSGVVGYVPVKPGKDAAPPPGYVPLVETETTPKPAHKAEHKAAPRPAPSPAAQAWGKLTAPPPESSTPLATRQDAMQALREAGSAANLSHMPAIAGQDGSIEYPFGYSRPVVVGAPGQVSTFEMQPGFQPSGYSVSQPASWIIKEGMAGNQPVLFIQPRFRYLHANLVVYGSFNGKPRIYQARLVSDRVSYTPLVGYYYPRQIVDGWTAKAQAAAASTAKAQAETVTSLPSLNVADMHFNYSIKCTQPTGSDGAVHHYGRSAASFFFSMPAPKTRSCSLAPSRVFSDGSHTYIQMPAGINHGSLPIVMGTNSAGQDAVLNYAYHPRHHLFVIDSVPSKLVMLIGVGSHQSRVTIREK